MSRITPEKQDELYLPLLDELVEEALSDYEPTTEIEQGGYHVRRHGEGVLHNTLSNRRILVEAGVKNIPSLYVAAVEAASHDSGYYRYFTDPAIAKQFPSPEAYSQHLANERQEARGVDEATREEVGKGIMGTKAAVRCRTWGQFILCAGDMHTTMLEDRTEMQNDTVKLRYEHAALKRDLGEIGFKVLSVGILATYNQINLSFPRMAEAGDVFTKRHAQMRQNILLMGQEVFDQTGQEVKELIHQICPPFLAPVVKLFGISKNEPENPVPKTS